MGQCDTTRRASGFSFLDRPVFGPVALEVGLQQLLCLLAHSSQTGLDPAYVGVVGIPHNLGQLFLGQA